MRDSYLPEKYYCSQDRGLDCVKKKSSEDYIHIIEIFKQEF